MSTNMTDYITTTTIPIDKLMTEGTGFFIPEYQRPYTWKKDDINRLFETIERALKIDTKEEYFAFLGTILVVDRPIELEKTYNIKRSESPDTVYVLIDGQQRITSLILIIAEIYKKLLLLKEQISNIQIDDTLIGVLNEALENSKSCLFIKNKRHPDKKIFLPKIINGQKNDKWKKDDYGMYNSPIAKYLVNLAENPESVIDDTKIHALTKNIQEKIQSFPNSNIDLLDIIKNHVELQNKFLGTELSNELIILLDNANSDTKNLLLELLLTLVLQRFVIEKIMFAQIRVDKESFAFDIFDSLNSTGDLLTAVETFKPLVIRTLSQKVFENSKEKQYLEKFDEFIMNQEKADRHTITKKFIVSLALYENGHELQENLNRQREYLHTRYKDPKVQSNIFCKHIADLTSFYFDIWNNDPHKLPNTFSSEMLVCISLLIKTKHTIVIPILARYYTDLILEVNVCDTNYKLYSKIVQTITCFSLFWRLIHQGSTASIDSLYREILANNISTTKKMLTLTELQNKFQSYLNRKATSDSFNKKDFSRLVSRTSYSSIQNNAWLKFFLLVSMHDSTIDLEEAGLEKPGVPNCNPTIRLDRWDAMDPLTIEHIAPQRPKDPESWDAKLLLSDYLHSIGNLTLLPKQKNALVGNNNWPLKKEVFRILALPDPEKRLLEISKIEKDAHVEVTPNTKKVLLKSDFWINAESLSRVEDWNSKIVEKRRERLTNLVWDNLAPWLGLDT